MKTIDHHLQDLPEIKKTIIALTSTEKSDMVNVGISAHEFLGAIDAELSKRQNKGT